ncbi:MAG: 4Fe-4S dicluster domain-containing protein [Gemmataceae bacterium]|nr:4Fe-4S dicluster domain-containing protein [Gemmataceae bacterium]
MSRPSDYEFPGLENWFESTGEAIGVGFDRRRFLQLMAASLGLAGMIGCRRPSHEILPFARQPEEMVPGLPTFYATSIPRPESSLPVIVESHEGRPTKIEGNPLHPTTAGATDVWAQASVLDLYDPHRAKEVRRDGNPSTWEEFDAWAASHFDKHLKNRGRGLAFLVEAIPSPALRMLREYQQQVAPEALWCAHSPLVDVNSRAGTALAFGSAMTVTWRLDQAHVLLCLDADPLGCDVEMVRHSRGFAGGRRAKKMNRLYVVEPNVTITGMNADHRLPLPASRIVDYALALWRILRGESAELPGVPTAWLTAVADDLKQHPGNSLVMVGPRQPPLVHALAHHLNEMLQNRGTTVEYRRNAELPGEPLSRLTDALDRKQIETLVILGDPGFDGSAPNLVRLNFYPQQAGGWELPAAHYLESWGDTETRDGTYAPVQPLIAPLYDGRTPLELLARLLKYDLTDGFEIVRRSFARRSGRTDDLSFRRWLHEGVWKDSKLPPVAVECRKTAIEEAAAAYQPRATGEGQLPEVARFLEYRTYLGRRRNGWLQELPDPVTKLTWDSAVLVGPRTAEQLQIRSGDLLSVQNTVLPALIVPGHAEGCLSLPAETAPGFASGVPIERVPGRRELAITQEHGRMEGRDLARVRNLGQSPSDHHADGHHGRKSLDLAVPPTFDGPNQWGMVIDLTACTGCSACVIACQAENNIPIVGKEEVIRGREMHWIRMDRYLLGDPDTPEGFVSQPVMCVHCESAPCEPVCPVNASVHSPEGLNLQVYNRCVGTRYCLNNCPYKARRFNWFDYHQRPLDELRLGPLADHGMAETLKMQKNPDVTVRMRGVMEKCTYCVQRIERAKIGAKLKGGDGSLPDGAVVPACAQACPAAAITFGNLSDPNSRVARLKHQDDNYSLLGELNTKPRTTYRVRWRNPNPALMS